MTRYLVWINKFIVEDNISEYDFLAEMYPEIKELYNMLWYIKNNSKKPYSYITRSRINKLNNEINKKLKIAGIPEYILVLKNKNEFIEPVSNSKLNIVEKYINFRRVGIMVEREYMENLNTENIDFLNRKIPLFIKNDEKIKRK